MATKANPRKQGRKKNRKHGRNANGCKAYALSHRREHNKIARLKKRLARFPEDAAAKAAIERCKQLIRGM